MALHRIGPAVEMPARLRVSEHRAKAFLRLLQVMDHADAERQVVRAEIQAREIAPVQVEGHARIGELAPHLVEGVAELDAAEPRGPVARPVGQEGTVAEAELHYLLAGEVGGIERREEVQELLGRIAGARAEGAKVVGEAGGRAEIRRFARRLLGLHSDSGDPY